MPEEKDKNWPAWYYGPKGAAKVFTKQDDVPDGWVDHPSKVGKKTAKADEDPVEPVKAGKDPIEPVKAENLDL